MTNKNIKSAALPRVAVAIVSYNTSALTARAIQTVLDSAGVQLDIHVVDNHSTDRTLSTLRRRFQVAPNQMATTIDSISATETAQIGNHQLTVWLADANLGFGRANNLVIDQTDAEYLLFLNSDTEVKPDTIVNLVRQFERLQQQPVETAVLARWQRRIENPGIIAAQLLNPDGSVQRQGGALPTLGNIFRWISFVDDLPGLSRLFSSYQHQEAEMRSISRRIVTKVGWVGGTAMMISRPCLSEIGGFDPKIFMYGEDVDLCWRATERHWDVVITSTAEVIHLGSASSSKKNAILGEISGLVYLWEKHHNLSEFRLLKFVLRWGLRWRSFIFGILHRYGQQRIYREALALV